MGEFSQQLFAEGDNGYPHGLRKLDGQPFEMTDLENAHSALKRAKRGVVMGALDVTAEHKGAVIKVRREFNEEAITRLGNAGIGETPIDYIAQ